MSTWDCWPGFMAGNENDGNREGEVHTEDITSGRIRTVAHVHPGTDGGNEGSFNCANALPLHVNSLTSVPVETQNFKGQVLYLHRQADGIDHPYVDHFSRFKRQCEFRVQGVFKKAPRELYGVWETEEVQPLSYTGQAFMRALLALADAIAAAAGTPFLCNMDTGHDLEGNLARPYWAWPMYSSEYVSRTPAGEEAPPITQPITEMTVQEKREELEKMKDGDTLTFAFWEQTLDFENWTMCNLPLGMNIEWSSLLGDKRIHIAFYDWVGPGEGLRAGVQSQVNKEYLFSIVFERVGHDPKNRVNLISVKDAHDSTTGSVSSSMPMRESLVSALKRIVWRLCDCQGQK